jgi:hypothetical protein
MLNGEKPNGSLQMKMGIFRVQKHKQIKINWVFAFKVSKI